MEHWRYDIPHCWPEEEQQTFLHPPHLCAASQACHLRDGIFSKSSNRHSWSQGATFAVSPSDKLMDLLSFRSSLRSGVLRCSPSGLRPPEDLSPGEEPANTTGPPLGGGMSMPIRRYFLRLLLIHVCKMWRKKAGNFDKM